VAGKGTSAGAQSAATAPWKPALHELDDWMAQLPGQHRFIIDTVDPEGFTLALPFANNYFRANQSGYGLKDSDLAVIVVARHHSTPFAFNDAMWAKYGVQIGKRGGFVDPETRTAPKSNVHTTALNALLKRGVHLAVCQLATRAYAGDIATAVGSTTEDIYKELSANLVSNSHLVPAGIVAVNRAQERGYSFARA
jgi:intracellular sulfur oxidation DsrE/DsrF family protein